MDAVFEMGLNHLGDLERAKRMLTVLAGQGAARATIQVILEPEKLTRAPEAVRFLKKNVLTLEQNLSAIRHGVRLGLQVGAAVTEPEDIRPLIGAGTSFFKILSADITYGPLLLEAASTGLPVYVSTGASETPEIESAVQSMRSTHAAAAVRLIHTVLVVPTPPRLLNLRSIPAMAAAFQCPVAYGQHSAERQAILTAVAAGAESVFVYVAEEKTDSLPDGPHAILCHEVGELLQQIRSVEAMLGCATRPELSDEERVVRPKVRRSIVAARPITAGTFLGEDDVVFKRPATGLSPIELPLVIGTVASQDYQPDEDLAPACAAHKGEPQ
jgi:sialic acid synthase SpsE